MRVRSPNKAAFLYVFVLLYLVVSVWLFRQVRRADRIDALRAEGGFHEVKVSPARLIGAAPVTLGSPDAKYTVVEFADYQCGPCRAQSSKVRSLIARSHGLARLVFRNFPLVNIHPLALRAAVASVSARHSSAYSRVHECLMESELNEASIRACSALPNSLSPTETASSQTRLSAERQIREDVSTAREMGLSDTPSFLLIDPSGVVRQFRDIPSLESYMDAG